MVFQSHTLIHHLQHVHGIRLQCPKQSDRTKNTNKYYHNISWKMHKRALDLNAQMFDAVRETWVDRWTWLDY